MTRKPTVSTDSVAQDQIRAFVERIERMDEEIKALNDDKKEIFAEAKGNGFDTKALKIVIRKRAQDYGERMELEAIVELYEAALGMRAAPRDYDDEEPRAPAPARTREIIEEFGAETGELEPASSDPKPESAADAEGEGMSLASSSATHQPETANERLDDLGSVQDGRKMSMDGQQGGGAATADEEPTPVVPAAALTNSNTREGAPATGEGAHNPTSPAVAGSNVTELRPAKKQWKHSDKAHPDCLNAAQCGGFSNLGLCPQCREAAAGGQVA